MAAAATTASLDEEEGESLTATMVVEPDRGGRAFDTLRVMASCCYCSVEAYNVIEVRYARTVKHLSTGDDEDKAPREIIGRGYYICDGCLALLDYRANHHLDRRRLSVHNALMAFYQSFAVWGTVAVGSMAGSMRLIKNPAFLVVGAALAALAAIAWMVRGRVYVKYVLDWRKARDKPRFPINSLSAFTDLRDRLNPELNAYLPVRYEDSIRLARLPGSPPMRALGPNGEPWGEGAQTNFPGSGDHEWYRLVWISWRLWPLTGVLEPETPGWRPPLPPYVSGLEVSGATLGAGLTFVLLLLLGDLPLWAPVTASFLFGGAGWFIGKLIRDRLDERQVRRAGGAGQRPRHRQTQRPG